MLSVIIIAKNEEKNIRNCLESVSWADEVIVLDSGSTDSTVAIAQEYTNKVYKTDWRGYGVQKQRALDYASGDWVLNLDADESVSPKLKEIIVAKIRANQADGFRIPIKMNFYGKPLNYSSSPSRHIRLFRRDGSRYSDDIVHEKIIMPPNAKIEQIKEHISHNSFQDVSHALYKINKYSSYTAKTRILKHKKSSFSKTIGASIWMFLRCYILQCGFLDGRAGFLFAVFNAQGTFYRGIKQIYQDAALKDIPCPNGEGS